MVAERSTAVAVRAHVVGESPLSAPVLITILIVEAVAKPAGGATVSAVFVPEACANLIIERPGDICISSSAAAEGENWKSFASPVSSFLS